MKIPGPVVDAVVWTEQALDRLKLTYKARFDRFDPAAVVPYRGHGTPDRLILRGRVLEASEAGFEPEPGLVDNIRNTVRRLETDEIRGARIRARFRDMEVEVQADDEAFFELRLDLDPPVDPGWHRVRLEVLESMAEEHDGPVDGEVLVPPPDADFIVISDLDDTVLRTGATDRFAMFRTVLLNDARTRMPFEGVDALYAALEAGPGGKAFNPFFYLSRSPWNMYDMLEGFLAYNGLPKGPIMLKDYGLRGILSGEQDRYKHEILEELMAFYPEHQFLLIGDSGQKDPEIYREIALANPDRIRAVVIRDVTPSERDRQVRAIAGELEEKGVPMILAKDSAEAGRKAAELGLIEEGRVARIEAERKSEDRRPGFLKRLLEGSLKREES